MCFFFLFNAKDSRPISAENSPKVPLLDENLQKEIEREREAKEKFQRENEEMKQKLSQLAIEPSSPSSSNLQVN